MKRLLFVITTSDYGGTETYLRQLVARLDRSRFEPVVCSLCPLGKVGQQIAESGVETFTLGMHGGTRLWQLATGIRRLAREIDHRQVDLAVGLLYRANVMAALACRLAKRRPIFIGGQRSLNPGGQRLMVWGVRATRRLCHHVIAVSPAVRDEILATERYPAERITVLRNGVDTDRWRQDDARKARRQWQVEDQALVIGAAGRLMPVKGFDDLIEAVALLRKDQPAKEIQVLIAGDGAEAGRLQERIDAHDLGGQIRLVGRLDPDQLRSLYSACDVYALTSRAEGSPNAMLEAMSCGCAVVATAVGGVPDILETPESGLMIEPRDAEALAKELAGLASDEASLERFKAGAQRRIRDEFSLDRMVTNHEEFLTQRLAP